MGSHEFSGASDHGHRGPFSGDRAGKPSPMRYVRSVYAKDLGGSVHLKRLRRRDLLAPRERPVASNLAELHRSAPEIENWGRTRHELPWEFRRVEVRAAPAKAGTGHGLVLVQRNATRTSDCGAPGPAGYAGASVGDAASRALVDRSGLWTVTTGGAQASVGSFPQLLDAVGRLGPDIHSALLGAPAAGLGAQLDWAPLQVDVLGSVATAARLPFDGVLREAKLLLQVTGSVAGVATGNVHVTAICLKSWLHDRVRDRIAGEIKGLVAPRSAPRSI